MRALNIMCVCQTCKTIFKFNPSNKKNKYCSMVCYRIFQKNYSYISCQNCGEQVRSYARNVRKYCSKKCYGESQERKAVSITKCGYCKKEFEMWNCRLKAGWYKYCSQKCQGEAQKGYTPWNKGLKSEQRGENHYNWQGGKTPENLRIRRSFEYTQWRRQVFERDSYTCIECGDNKGGNLEADHIKPFAYFPELRFDINNGRTLCKDCHKKTDTWGSKALKYKRELTYGN